MARDSVLKPEDHFYDPDGWEVTYNWDDNMMPFATGEYQLEPGEVKRFCTLVNGPDRFAAEIVIERDEDGEPSDTEIRWFETEEAAKSALGN